MEFSINEVRIFHRVTHQVLGMKICTVSHYSGNLDEGVRNIAKNISHGLSARGEITIPIEINNLASWKRMIKEKPDVIHFILTPTLNGLLAQKFASIISPKSKIIVSAIHPTLTGSRLVKSLRPDMILTQSISSKKMFEEMGWNVHFFPNGVDTTKFIEAGPETKRAIRNKYGINEADYLFLHLASLTTERNLESLVSIEKKTDCKVMIVGREHEVCNPSLLQQLMSNVSYLWQKHFDSIEEIYQATDCYIFPTKHPRACIETPLSVLEAMSCNLPIITTRFGALPDLFPEPVPGLHFIEDTDDLTYVIDKIKHGEKTDTRSAVMRYDWDVLFPKLMDYYYA